jgi:hypothetical protein
MEAVRSPSPRRYQAKALSLVLLGIVLLGMIFLAAHPFLGRRVESGRASATSSLRAMGINEPLRYHLHVLAAELALHVGSADFALEQYRRAEPHAMNDGELSAVFAGYAATLADKGDRKGSLDALRWAIVLDPHNERVNGLLDWVKRNP